MPVKLSNTRRSWTHLDYRSVRSSPFDGTRQPAELDLVWSFEGTKSGGYTVHRDSGGKCTPKLPPEAAQSSIAAEERIRLVRKCSLQRNKLSHSATQPLVVALYLWRIRASGRGRLLFSPPSILQVDHNALDQGKLPYQLWLVTPVAER